MLLFSVNSPSIAGTGRVGPRQRSRITYSSHSDEVASPDTESFSRPKYEDRTKSVYHENLHKSSNSRKSQLSPKKKDFGNKSPYFRKKEIRREDEKYHETESSQKEHKESQKSYKSKLEKSEESTAESLDTTANEKESNIISSGDSMSTVEIKNKDNQDDNLNLHINEKSEVHLNKEDDSVLQNLNLPASKIDTEIETCKQNEKLEDKVDESPNVRAIVTSECEPTETNLTTSSVKDDNDKNDKYVEYSSYDTNEDTKETVMENKDKDNSEQTKEILSDNCDNKQTKDMSEQENEMINDTKSSPEEKEINSVIPSSSDVCYIAEQNDKLKSENEVLQEKENLAIEDETITITDEKINTGDIILMKCISETQERTDNNERENNVANSIIVDKIESLKKNLHEEEEEEGEKAASGDQN